ncbi:MAG: HD domain-containing protein [Clostridia bacterium]|nr:HD domain-containing protein [Clostridia bacterium]
MTDRERFIDIYRKNIRREGADRLLEWLTSPSCDFFAAPASTRFHGSVRGGLCAHSLNVYDCLCDYLKNSETGRSLKGMDGKPFSAESIAIAALLHDLCKVNFYKVEKRNVKRNNMWEEVDYFSIEDGLPYGHGEKSVYIISKYMVLTRDEAFAIRYHMGFSVGATEERPVIEQALSSYPLAFALFASDAAATYFKEGMPE